MTRFQLPGKPQLITSLIEQVMSQTPPRQFKMIVGIAKPDRLALKKIRLLGSSAPAFDLTGMDGHASVLDLSNEVLAAANNLASHHLAAA